MLIPRLNRNYQSGVYFSILLIRSRSTKKFLVALGSLIWSWNLMFNVKLGRNSRKLIKKVLLDNHTVWSILHIDDYQINPQAVGIEILKNATLIIQKWLVSRAFANIFHYLNFSEEY